MKLTRANPMYPTSGAKGKMSQRSTRNQTICVI